MMNGSLAAFVAAVVTACSGATPQDMVIAPTDGRAPLAITNVNVVPMDSERILRSQTVLVRDGLISTVGASQWWREVARRD
jgi:hypothetical protein